MGREIVEAVRTQDLHYRGEEGVCLDVMITSKSFCQDRETIECPNACSWQTLYSQWKDRCAF